MALKGLVIRQPWIGMILRGEKVWEMRSTPCRHRGLIALIEKGSGNVVGIARIVDDLAPLAVDEMRSSFDKHRIPAEEMNEAIRQGWVRPWVLADVSRLKRPVPYNHTSGGSWVNLTSEEEAAILATNTAINSVTVTNHRSHQVDSNAAKTVQGLVSRVRIEHPELEVPADFKAQYRQEGNNLYVDMSWDDCAPARCARGQSRWVQTLGILALCAAGLSQIGFVIHLLLGIGSENISALSAFLWLLPVFVFAVLATLCGYGQALDIQS